MAVRIHLLGPDDAGMLDAVAPDVFDNPVDARWTAEFLADPRHHMVIALEGGLVVGMASGVNYVHPDKAPELWVNEVGVASTHRRRGIAKQLMRALFAHGLTLGCTDAWLGTERDNTAARRLYESFDSDEEAMIYYTFDLEDVE